MKNRRIYNPVTKNYYPVETYSVIVLDEAECCKKKGYELPKLKSLWEKVRVSK